MTVSDAGCTRIRKATVNLLEVQDLKTHFDTGEGTARAVDGVSFSMEEGESLALVGESACGKSVTALSLMRLIRPPGYHPGGRLLFEGRDLLQVPEAELRHIRGNRISMIFQEPMSSLNPVYTVANQLAEPLMLHQGMTAGQARKHSLALLEQMGIAAPEVVLKSYPHQLSGGMRQRAMIAMAIACQPRLMIADEPTTALDVTVQAQILHLIKELQREIGMALLLITHDLGVVNQMSDRVCVMYSGRVAEIAPRERLLHQARHPYTIRLLQSIPRGVSRDQRLSVIPGQVRSATDYPEGCRFAERCDQAGPRCETAQPPLYEIPEGGSCACYLHDPATPLPPKETAPAISAAHATGKPDGPLLLETRGLSTHFPVKKGFFQHVVGYVRAVDGVSLSIHEGTTLGLVGESGCGKTTLGHSLLNLEGHARGGVFFEGRNLLALSAGELRRMRKWVQIIFQDPFSSLNPRMTLGEVVGEGLRIHEPHLSAAEREARIREALEDVGLPAGIVGSYAHEFSGGQRQRIALARAIILRPRFIVLDEGTSALDVSVQAQILNLLRDLQARYNLTYLFITHDLGVVQYLAHQVAVMYLGRIVEYGPADTVLNHPAHPYTRSLLEAIPDIRERWSTPPALSGDVPSPVDPPQGCHFHPRCPVLRSTHDPRLHARCPAHYPEPVSLEVRHWVKCWAADATEPAGHPSPGEAASTAPGRETSSP